MKYQVIDKVLNNEYFSIVIKYFTDDGFERIENMDFEVQNLDINKVQEKIIERGRQIKLLYEMQQQFNTFAGEITDEQIVLEGGI